MKTGCCNAGLHLVLFGYIFFSMSGCAHVISEQIRNEAAKDLSLTEVRKDPSAHKGQTVVWGGVIVQATNQKDASVIEVVKKPTDYRGAPKDGDSSEGRFLVAYPGYLETTIYREGRKVTIAGEIKGEKTQPLGEITYSYPLLSGKEIHLWPLEEKRRYYDYPYPYWRHRWWYDPYHPIWW